MTKLEGGLRSFPIFELSTSRSKDRSRKLSWQLRSGLKPGHCQGLRFPSEAILECEFSKKIHDSDHRLLLQSQCPSLAYQAF